MSAWAKPGVKCVCVDDAAERFVPLLASWRHEDGFQLCAGITYTIREVLVHPAVDLVCVKLVELGDRSGRDFGYALHRFRPLITRTQEDDVSLFRKLLVTEGADA